MQTMNRCTECIALREGVFALPPEVGTRRLVAGHQAESFAVETPIEQEVLEALARDFVSEDSLLVRAAELGDADGVERARHLVERLRAGGWLRYGRFLDEVAQYVLEPVSRPIGDREAVADPVLSRFALLRRGEDHMILESPRSWCNIRFLAPEALAVTASLGTGRALVDVPAELAEALAVDLSWAGVLVERDGPETAEFSARQWGVHELWFHERSRDGHRAYLDSGFGGTDWARGTFPPVPARQEPRFAGERVVLPTPDLDALRRADPPLTAVLEDRRSQRRHDDTNPVTVAELGELLYRCARTRGMSDYGGVRYKDRPHPSGGSVYELEIYPLVRNVAGIEPGMYHYDTEDHELVRVGQGSSVTERLLRRARLSMQQQKYVPQVVLLISARFGRLMWRYEGMAYALVLKHVGVLYQSLYLVATAMNLAACGLGGGDSVLFAEATGLDPMVESSVGEFSLGRPLPTATTEERQ